MLANLATMLSDLDALNTEHAFARKFDQTFSSFGFNAFTYVGIKADTNDGASKINPNDVIVLTNANSAWVEHYRDEGYQNDDPIVRECFTSRLPIRWTEKFRANARNKREDAILMDGFDHGIRRGLTVPLHGPKGELGIMSLYSELADEPFQHTLDRFQYDLQMVSHYFHDAVQRNLQRTDAVPKPIALTEREAEILQWTALGKTAWEVGSILKISERTVNFHLQNAMTKLGVHNKAHAASKAVSVGLIHP